jgi:hypothetical protein
LEEFVDVGEDSHDFSEIADELHQLRNGTAHQWLTKQGHSLYLDGDMEEGWKKSNGTLYINPKIYADQILSAFEAGSAYYEKWRQAPPKVLKMRKYYFLKDWLDLDGDLSEKIKSLNPGMSDEDFVRLEEGIVDEIEELYGLN